MSGSVYTNIAKKRVEQSAAPALPAEPKRSPQSAPAQEQPTETGERSTSAAATDPQMSTNPQTHLSTNNSASLPTEKVEKYTTHLEPSLAKRIKLFATQHDMKDYQVVRDALLHYFNKNS